MARAPLRTPFRSALALALLLLASACLEIDGQELLLHHDPAADRVDVLLIHRGLFAERQGRSEPLPLAIEQLETAQRTGVFVLGNNFPLRFDPSQAEQSGWQRLAEHLAVENGGLFTDTDGRLCAYQFVRIDGLSTFLAKAEALLGIEFSRRGSELFGIDPDAVTREAMLEFVRGGGHFLHVEPGRIELRLPMSRADHERLRRLAGNAMADAAAHEVARRATVEARRGEEEHDPSDTSVGEAVSFSAQELAQRLAAAPMHRLWWDNDVSIARTKGLTTIALGAAGEGPLRLVKAAEGLYHPQLHEALRERGFPIERALPDEELLRRFVAFRGRAPHLPPALAEQRRPR